MALLDGIIGCWSLSLRGTGYIIPDLIFYANTGTLNNFVPGDSWAGSSQGLVLLHPGATQSRMTVTGSDATTIWTISWWQNFSDLTSGGNTNPTIFSFGSGAYTHTPYNGTLTFYQERPNDRLQGNYVANQWQNVIISENGSSADLFLDGTLVGTFTGGSASNMSQGFQFGNVFASGSSLQARYAGEFILWNRPISSAEANKVFTLGNGAIGREIIGLNQQLQMPKKLSSSKRRLLLTGQT